MSLNRPLFSEQKPRFSRSSLNTIIIVTAIMIILLSQSNRFIGEESSNHSSTDVNERTIAPDTIPTTPTTTPDAPQTLETLAEVPLAVPPAKTAPIDHWISSKGAKVYFSAAPEIPMIDIRILFSAGASRETPEYAGLAKLTNGILSEGSKHHTVDEIAAHFESLGAHFSSSAYRDMALTSLRSLTDPNYLTPALEMFTEVINEPAFPKEALQRNLELMRLSLKHEKQSPGRLSNKAFMNGLYTSHPYGHSPGGTQESLNRIKQKDLMQFHKAHYVAKNATVAIVGAITKEQAEAIAETITEKMAAGTPPAKLPAASLQPAQQTHVHFPSQQTHVIMGLPSITRDNPLHPYLYIANEIFGGGGFNSILLTEVREKRGLSYSASSGYTGMLAEGPFTIRLQTKNESAKEALDVVHSELKKFLEHGPTAEQVATAKNNILASFPLQLANNGRIVGHLGAIGFYDLPLNHLDRFYEKIASATVEEVHQAFNSVVKPDSLLTITLGPTDPNLEATSESTSESTSTPEPSTQPAP